MQFCFLSYNESSESLVLFLKKKYFSKKEG